MRILPFALFVLLLPLPALAQAPEGQSGRVKVDFTEVRAGPGNAYVSRGRVYQGDRVEVGQRNDSGDWIEISAAGGVRGWVRSEYLDLSGGEGVTRTPEGAVDAGRDRRETNYEYDERGRRLRPDGSPVGSGEGIDAADEAAFLADAEPAAGDRHVLAVRTTVGGSQIRRVFDSDLEGSALRHLELTPAGLRVGVVVDYLPLRYLAIRAAFHDHRLHEAQIGAAPDLGFDQDVALAAEAQQFDLDVMGRYPFGPAWAGAYGGMHLLRHAFQETSPFALLLTNTFIAVAGGAGAGVRLGPVDLSARGGVFFPVSISQEPADGGEADSLGFDASVEVAWNITAQWAVVGDFHFQRVQTDFTGGGAHQDTSGDAPRAYQVARETDSVMGGGVGARWRY